MGFVIFLAYRNGRKMHEAKTPEELEKKLIFFKKLRYLTIFALVLKLIYWYFMAEN